MTVEQINKQEETEIDLIEVIRKLWAEVHLESHGGVYGFGGLDSLV